MDLNTQGLAVAAVSALVAYLLELGQSVGKGFAEGVGKLTAEKIDTKGRAVAKKLASNEETKIIIEVLSKDPQDPDRRKIAVAGLSSFLRGNADFACELELLLGGPEAFQRITAEGDGKVKDVQQILEGNGSQVIEAKGEGSISGATQKKMKSRQNW